MTIAYLNPKTAQLPTSILAGKARNTASAIHINTLIHRWQQDGDIDARNEVIERNLRFIATVAKQRQGALTFEEAINCGVIGCAEACNRFDVSRGFRFISYAVHWIKQSIMEAQPQHGHIIRQPLNIGLTIGQASKKGARLEQERQRTVTTEEVIDTLGLGQEQRERIRAFAQMHFSLDAARESDHNERTYLETMAAPEPEDTSHVPTLLALLETLSKRERNILRRYYGIGQERGETLEAVGATIGLTRERVRQLRDRALLTLRSRAKKEGIEGFSADSG